MPYTTIAKNNPGGPQVPLGQPTMLSVAEGGSYINIAKVTIMPLNDIDYFSITESGMIFLKWYDFNLE